VFWIVLKSPGAVLFQIGALTVRWYGLIFALGFIAATAAARKLAVVRKIDPEQFLNCALICFLSGIIGARLYFVALNWEHFSSSPGEILAVWLGGLSIHGGIIGGLIGSLLYCRIASIPIGSTADIFGAVVPLGQAIGRWGNFFNSEAFGRPVSADFPIKLFIPESNRPPDFLQNEYFHPTFLYESVWDLLIFACLYFFLFYKLSKYPGMTFLAYLALYSIGRLFIEPMRLDSIMIGDVAAPYAVSAIMLATSLLGMILLGRRAKPEKAE